MAQNKVAERKRLVIIGGSAGSLEVLLQVLPGLGARGHFALVIVLHRKSSTESPLVDLLASRSCWPVQEAEEKQEMLKGHVYLAPADYHLLFEADGTLALDDSEKVNFSRPSIDVSFESAAEVYGSDVVAVLLSGANADGVAGLQRIEASGGLAWVQDPSSAAVAYMPAEAIRAGAFSRILSVEELFGFLKNHP